jgi:hypothetical protein
LIWKGGKEADLSSGEERLRKSIGVQQALAWFT